MVLGAALAVHVSKLQVTLASDRHYARARTTDYFFT